MPFRPPRPFGVKSPVRNDKNFYGKVCWVRFVIPIFRIFHEEHYYINESRLFDTLTELVDYYVENGDNLDLILLYPVKKSSQISRLDQREIVRKDKIGSGHFGEVHIASLDRAGIGNHSSQSHPTQTKIPDFKSNPPPIPEKETSWWRSRAVKLRHRLKAKRNSQDFGS